jgi:hypothetical protein
MSLISHSNDYSRYFGLRQKVYLINMSAERNCDIYESLSGFVTASNVDSVELMITHCEPGTHDAEVGKATYKLTSEALGSGIQVLANLIGVVAGNIFQFRLHGALEMFQRRTVPRVVLSARIFHLRKTLPLESFKKEWRRIIDHLRHNSVLQGLTLQKTTVDLSAGGIGLTVELINRPTPLSMFFIALDTGPPVCTLAETVWEQHEDEGVRCGFRFIQILKADQERINNCVSDEMRKNGGTYMDYKRNWVLVDRMVADGRKAE